MSVDWYYVGVDSSQNGPVTLDDVKAAFKAKKVAGSCLVWNENMTDWVAFSTVPELKALLAPAPIAPKKPPSLPGAAAAAAAAAKPAPVAAAPKPVVAAKPTVSAATIQKAASPAPSAAAPAAAKTEAKKFSAPKKATNAVAPAPAPAGAPAGLAAAMAAAKKPTSQVAPGKLPEKPKSMQTAPAAAAAAKPVEAPAKAPTPEPAAAPAAGPKKFAAPTKAAATPAAAAKPEVKTAAPAAVAPKKVIPSPAATPPPSDDADAAPAKPIARVPSNVNAAAAADTYKPATVQRVAPNAAPKKSTTRVDSGDKPSFLKAARCTGRGKGKAAADKKAEAKKPVKAVGKDNVMEVEVDWQELKTPEGVPYYHNKKTNVTSWDKPDCLKTGDELDKAGDWVWMPSEVEQLAFVPARKIDVAYDGRIQCETDDGKMHWLPKGTNLEPLKWSSLRRLQRDLVMLDVMNQPLILHNLRERFKSNEIYTNVGTILISVNPYKRLPLYTPTIISEYRNRGNRALAPHVFTISDDSYNNLIENGQGQSIVISGESGAGKTECTKQCLQYLAEIAGSSNNVEQKILMANPILEAFGNAKTVRNNNSSRFGKYVEIFFDDRASICGAKTLNYLLEKSRVCHQTGDERNYHVFYQLCQGLTAAQKAKYKLKDALSYSYLNQSGNVTIDDVDDGAEYADMNNAFSTIGFTQAEVEAVFQTTIGVLHLGNVSFKSSGEKKCEVDNKAALADAAALFEVTTADLVKGITNRTVRVKGQQDINVSLSKHESESMRNALARFVYAKLFDWLVVKINDSIGVGKAKKTRSIGILDIFGFEIFQVNYFEQLCINYCNEKLQQFFNAHTFKLEETVYRQEKIDFKSVNYIDNQPVLDFIEKKPEGILPSIDEELKMPKGTDQTWLEKLHKRAKGNPCYQMLIKTPEKFVVRHYAGDVTYESEGFLVKNLDKMSEDLFELLAGTKFQFLQSLFEADRSDAAANRKETLGAKFAKQLNDLMATLNSTEPHYIRCVKPNKTKAPMDFNAGMVLQQLQYSGVFEAVQIRKSGFPFRYTHADFRKRYKCVLGAGKARTWPNDQAACLDLVKEMKQDLKNVQMGVTKVLYRAEQHQNMELIRNLAVDATCTFLQSHIRAWCVRRLATRMWRLRPVLQDAMATRTLAAVEAALQKCDGIKFEMYEITQTKRLKHVLLEEKRLTALLDTLLKQDPEAVFEDLSKAVAACDEIKFVAPLAERARKTLTEITDRKQARAWLSEGVEEADIEKLQWALQKAKEYNLPGVAAQVKAATDMVERIKKENVILDKLKKFTAAGGYLKEGDTINFKELEPAVAEAKKFELKTPEGKRVGRLAAMLLDLRKKLSAALGSKDKDKWKAVESVLLASHEDDKDHGEVTQAREEVSHQAAIDDVCDKLEAAVTALDQDTLTHYLDQAAKLAINEDDYPVVPIARQYLERIVECRQIMAKAMEVVEQTQLEYAVEYAESFNYDTHEVKACRSLRDKVIQLNVETEYALKMLEEEPMKDILKRADAIKMTTDGIEKVRTLIFNTSEEKFVQLQLKATVALGDAARRTRVTIRLKDLFYKKSAAMFVLDNYPKLRSPAGWADLKFISFNRELLAAGCRKHTKEPIHNALTELDSPSDKIAQNMFKNVLGFMGDRAYPDPIHLVQEILKLCLEPANAWLRPEIYCQVIKQVTANPSQESLQKGWQLMAICLETFPPGEFENYLEMWLRTNAKPPERYIRLLHGTVYGGARQSVPSTADIQTIISGGTLSKINWEEKTDYKAPVANLPPRKGAGAVEEPQHKQQAPAAAAAAARPAIPPKSGAAIARGKPAPSVAGGVPPPPMDDAPPGPPEDMPPPAPADDAPPPAPDDAPPPAPSDAPPVVRKGKHGRRDSKPPPMKPKKVSLWATAQDPDTGDTYYYHQETGEVTWDKPADFDG